MSRPQIFIADLLHALDQLEVTSPDVAQLIMRMLSLESWAEIASAPQAVSGLVTPAPAIPFTIAPEPASAPAVAGSKTPAESAPGERMLAAVTEIQGPLAGIAPPTWALGTTAMPRALRYGSPAAEPLFDALQQRTLVACLAATLDHEGPIDIESLVAQLSRGEPLGEVPHLRGFSLRRGLQVLVDQGAGMAPFERDVEQLLGRLRGLVPDDRIFSAGFEGSPLRGCRVGGKKRRPWQPCPLGTPTLLLTDLGIARADDHGRPADVQEWLKFAEQAATAGVQLRTLVPYPPSRWPGELALRLRCVQWDRRTTAALVRRTVTLGMAS